MNFKNKKFLRRQRQPSETSSGGNWRRYGVAYTSDPTPHQSAFSPNGFCPCAKGPDGWLPLWARTVSK